MDRIKDGSGVNVPTRRDRERVSGDTANTDSQSPENSAATLEASTGNSSDEPTQVPISIDLLLRITEVIRGLTSEDPVYVVCRNEPLDNKWDVQAPTPDRARAEARRDELNGGLGLEAATSFRVLGPFRNKLSKTKTTVGLDEAHVRFRGALALISIREKLASIGFGDPMEDIFADLIVWTEPGFMKFIYPYYLQYFGKDKAEEAKATFLKDDVLLMIHLPTTDYVNPTAVGAESPPVLVSDMRISRQNGRNRRLNRSILDRPVDDAVIAHSLTAGEISSSEVMVMSAIETFDRSLVLKGEILCKEGVEGHQQGSALVRGPIGQVDRTQEGDRCLSAPGRSEHNLVAFFGEEEHIMLTANWLRQSHKWVTGENSRDASRRRD